MSEITPQLVKTLRDKTNAGMMDCKRALAEAGGDLEKAEDLLRKKGIVSAGKKSTRATKEGVIASYIHMQGKVGVLVEINCETDFVAKNESFRDFVKDITLHIAASSPICVSRDQVCPALVAREREIAVGQIEEEGKKSGKPKPANIVEKIVDGKIDKFLASICLLDQPFIKNPDQTIEEFVKSKIAELGENIIIRRFTRYVVGEALDAAAPAAEAAE
ncbi:MAG: translation elongation factor Ts [Verrucomicrobiota bacterium]